MKTIKLAEYGIVSGIDITMPLYRLFQEHRENTIFEFEDGDYYFTPYEELKAPYVLSNTDFSDYKQLGIWMRNMKNCILRGNGARLWFAGQMQPITIDHCDNVTIQGVVIDWEKPLVAEGKVVDYRDNWVKLYVDNHAFPHRYQEDWLEFDVGADEWYKLLNISCIQYDADSLCIRRDSGDKFKPVKIEDEGNNVYKITSVNPVNTAIGNIFVLRHNSRLHAGIFMEASSDVVVEHVTVHSCGGLGCLSQFCHNVRFEHVFFVPNTKLGRKVVNGRDDGMHITSNTGQVVITHCNFVGLMDDPINVHGCGVVADEIINPRTLRCTYQHIQAKGFLYWAAENHEISFVDRRSMVPLHKMLVDTYHVENVGCFTLSFKEDIPVEILELVKQGNLLALENLTNTAEFICTKNRFGSCRARGILISTPKRVLVENNYFETSGSAILVAGDSNQWFESGACYDVTIRNNVFTNQCNSSRYQFCEGVISICPVVPEADNQTPYHRNIRICDNVFDVTTSRSVYALSCENLQIENNTIFTSATSYLPEVGGSIKLVKCNGVVIKNNDIIGDLKGAFVVNEDSIHVAEELGK